jgi:hypothetical protein
MLMISRQQPYLNWRLANDNQTLVEPGGIEPPTLCLQSRCSPS